MSIADEPEPWDPARSVRTTSTSTLVVDGTPPVISVASVTLSPHTPGSARAHVTATVVDGLAGVASVTWHPGDGSPRRLRHSTASAVRGSRPSRGCTPREHRRRRSPGRVARSTCGAGTASRARPHSQTFTFSFPPGPGDRPRAHRRAPRRRPCLQVAVRLAERGRVSAIATVRIAGRTHRLRQDGEKLTAAGVANLRLAADSRTRRAIRRALAKRRAVRADVRIVASDVLGNDTVARRTVAIRG